MSSSSSSSSSTPELVPFPKADEAERVYTDALNSFEIKTEVNGEIVTKFVFNYDTIKAAMTKMGNKELTDADIKAMEAELNETPYPSIDKVLNTLLKNFDGCRTIEDMASKFKVFDREDHNDFYLEEYKYLMNDMGLKLTDEEIEMSLKDVPVVDGKIKCVDIATCLFNRINTSNSNSGELRNKVAATNTNSTSSKEEEKNLTATQTTSSNQDTDMEDVQGLD